MHAMFISVASLLWSFIDGENASNLKTRKKSETLKNQDRKHHLIHLHVISTCCGQFTETYRKKGFLALFNIICVCLRGWEELKEKCLSSSSPLCLKQKDEVGEKKGWIAFRACSFCSYVQHTHYLCLSSFVFCTHLISLADHQHDLKERE